MEIHPFKKILDILNMVLQFYHMAMTVLKILNKKILTKNTVVRDKKR